MRGMRKETEEKYKEICRLFWAGKSLDEIAEETHCSRATVDRAISTYGNIPKRDNFESHKEEAIEMFKAGKTYQEIADATGLFLTTIRRNFAQLGFRRRNRKRVEKMPEREEELEIFPLQYTQNNIRRAERIEIRGKKYWDVSAWYM